MELARSIYITILDFMRWQTHYLSWRLEVVSWLLISIVNIYLHAFSGPIGLAAHSVWVINRGAFALLGSESILAILWDYKPGSDTRTDKTVNKSQRWTNCTLGQGYVVFTCLFTKQSWWQFHCHLFSIYLLLHWMKKKDCLNYYFVLFIVKVWKMNYQL